MQKNAEFLSHCLSLKKTLRCSGGSVNFGAREIRINGLLAFLLSLDRRNARRINTCMQKSNVKPVDK